MGVPTTCKLGTSILLVWSGEVLLPAAQRLSILLRVFKAPADGLFSRHSPGISNCGSPKIPAEPTPSCEESPHLLTKSSLQLCLSECPPQREPLQSHRNSGVPPQFLAVATTPGVYEMVFA